MSAILKQKLIDIANGFTKYGLWKGGGSGVSSALSDMTDVSFTNLQTNDILKYNGSVWINDDNLHEYSTEEKVVGKWIDGKPIYEITIKINSPIKHGVWTNIAHLKNVKYLINGYLLGDKELSKLSGFEFQIINDNLNINQERGGVWNSDNFYLFIQYTKTTD